jgi:tetratricopeptide (TPR) repeat protein
VHCNLGLALEQTGRRDESIEQYKLALKFKPDMADAQNALARLQTGQR